MDFLCKVCVAVSHCQKIKTVHRITVCLTKTPKIWYNTWIILHMSEYLVRLLAKRKLALLNLWKKQCTRVRPGTLLVEALMGIFLFGLFATASFLTLLTGQESSETGSDRVRGVYYTEQLLEVARSIRDRSFDDLTVGSHGYTIDQSGNWVLSGATTTRYGVSTYLVVNSLPNGRKGLTAHSSWKHGYHRSGATVLSLELVDWRTQGADGIRDWGNPSQTGSVVLTNTSATLNDVYVSGTAAYVTSDSVGDGLYIYNVTDATNPTRISSTFTLSGEAHKPVIYSDTLFVAVEDGGDEIKAYDVTDPTSLTSSTPTLATYDIPGGINRAKALFAKNGTLYVGATGDASESEFYALDISSSGSITLLGSLNITGMPNIFDVYVRGNYAYLATSKDTQEMIVVDVSSPSSMSQHASYNATDVHDAYAVRSTSTGFYLGRTLGASIDEYVLVTGSGGTPSANVSNTYGADMAGVVNAMDVDPLGCYMFMATGFSTKELQIRTARYKTVVEEASVNLTNNANGVMYDLLKDRLYVTTNTGMLIFDPGTATGACT